MKAPAQMSRTVGLATALALVLALPEHPIFASPSVSAYIVEYEIPTPDSRPSAIGADADGNIWFVESDSAQLARFNPRTREFVEFRIPTGVTRRVEAGDLVADANGCLWFTDSTGHMIWRFDIARSAFDKYVLTTRDTLGGHTFLPTPLRLALDGKGGVWFTELHGNRIGRVAADEAIAEFELAVKRSRELPFGGGPAGITIDRTGIVWVTEAFSGKLAKFDPVTQQFREYAPPRRIYSPAGIAVDSQGLLWVADHGSSRLIRYDPETGFMREYATPRPPQFPTSLPYWVVVDPLGDVWFNEHQGNKIARFKPDSEVLIEYHLPTKPLANALSFTIDRDGNVWFTELTANKIGMVKAAHSIGIEMQLHMRLIRLKPGSFAEASLRVAHSASPTPSLELDVSSSITPGGRIVNASAEYDVQTVHPKPGHAATVTLFIRAAGSLTPGTYTLTVSASDQVLTYSNFLTLIVGDEPPGVTIRPSLSPLSIVVIAFGLGIPLALWARARLGNGRGRF